MIEQVFITLLEYAPEAALAIGVTLALGALIYRMFSLVFQGLAQRNADLASELMQSKTESMANDLKAVRADLEATNLRLAGANVSLENLRTVTQQLRSDLDAETVLRKAQTARAIRAEQRAAQVEEHRNTLMRDLELKQVVIDTLMAVFARLNVSVPPEHITVTIGHKDTNGVSTDEITAVAENAVKALAESEGKDIDRPQTSELDIQPSETPTPGADETPAETPTPTEEG